MEEERELGSPLAVAAFEAVRALVWQAARYEAVPPDDLARDLEKGCRGRQPKGKRDVANPRCDRANGEGTALSRLVTCRAVFELNHSGMWTQYTLAARDQQNS